MAQKYVFSTESRTEPAGGQLAAVLGQQLVGSAVSLQGVLGVEVLRQLGLAAHQSPVLLQVLLCLELQTQGVDYKPHCPYSERTSTSSAKDSCAAVAAHTQGPSAL